MVFDTTQLPGPPDDRAWSFVESFGRETDVIRSAREKALERSEEHTSELQSH